MKTLQAQNVNNEQFGTLMCILLCVIVSLGAASPAFAKHKSGKRQNDGVIVKVENYSSKTYSKSRLAQREYDRGFSAGERDGFDDGFDDGSRGLAYCGTPPATFCDVSNHFRRGYLDAYADAYCAGYDRGEREYRFSRTRCRTTSWSWSIRW